MKYYFYCYLFLCSLITFSCNNDEQEEGESEKPNNNYIEVGGIKWAKGNLLYDNGIWKIAEKQWRFYLSDKNQVGLFNYGMISTTSTGWYHGDNEICGNPEYDIARFRLGEPWRLPSRNEMDLLLGRASRAYGYCIGDNKEKICGWYFYNNDGNQEIGTIEREITEKELEHGIFLPFSKVRSGSGSIFIKEQGAYWTGTPYGDNEIYASYLKIVYTGMFVGVEPDRYTRWNGLAVRPVYAK